MTRPAPPRVTVDITVESDGWRSAGDLEALAERAVETALAETGDSVPDHAELSIVLCDDAFIADLNAKWRGLAKPTNVLSFPTDYSAHAPGLGDIVIAYETVSREADEEQKSLRDHLTHMIVHGFLHLLGFDHDVDEEAEAMEAMETRILATLGIASPYDPEHRNPVLKLQAEEDRRPTQ